MKKSCAKDRNTLFLVKKQYGKGGPKNTSKHSERHNMRRKTTIHKRIKPSDVVLIKADNKNRGKWNMGIVTKLFQENGDEIRSVELRAGKDKLKRAMQNLFKLELSCDINRQPDDQLNVNVKELWVTRNPAAAADLR